jgi:hypothetical protein
LIAERKGEIMKRWQLNLNLLGVIAGCVMIAAMFFPWWSFRLAYSDTTDLFPYLISGPGSELVGYKRSPQMTILTGVLIACIVLCFLGSVLRGRSGRILLAVSGLLVFVGAWRLLVRVGSVAARFELPIQGHGIGTYGGFAAVEVWTWIRPGLYLIIVAGVLSIIAAIFNNQLRLRIFNGAGD